MLVSTVVSRSAAAMIFQQLIRGSPLIAPEISAGLSSTGSGETLVEARLRPCRRSGPGRPVMRETLAQDGWRAP